MDQKHLILHCRFYNGEEEAPEWMIQNAKMFWFYERCWVVGKSSNLNPDYISEHPSMRDFEVEDGTPQDLKALLCDRYCHFGGTDDDFKEFYKLEYQVRITNKQRKGKEWELRHCRLFDGSGSNEYEAFGNKPFNFREPTDGYKENKTLDEIKEILAIFYFIEKFWILFSGYSQVKKNYQYSQLEKCLGKDYEINDGTPRELQVLLLNGFIQSIDGFYHRFETQYEYDLFKRYYKEYYLPILTPNQKRDKERRPKLIEKCRYYKGEDENPWEFCYSPVLVYRKDIWNTEKEWVDAMVCSYNCPQSSKELIKELVLEEYFKAKGVALSLLNLILSKEKQNTNCFGAIEAIKAYEKYEKLAPLANDHKKYFAFYLGEEECPYGYEEDEEFKRMGWTQEKLQFEQSNQMCDFDSKDFQKKHRGKEGIWGWYADPKYPQDQKDILYFSISNWGIWCPYCDEDKLAEEYINFHYPGDGKPKHSNSFYWEIAYELIKDDEYYRTVHKCGVYQGKRAYKPIFKDEYILEPPCIGLPMVILVDDEGNAEYIRDLSAIDIYQELSRTRNSKSSAKKSYEK